MKKSLLFISALVAGSLGYAQSVTVPNGGFESWSNANLDSWSDSLTTVTTTSLNGAYFDGPTSTQYQTADSVVTDVNNGSNSVLVRTTATTVSGISVIIPGIMVSGNNASATIATNVNVTGSGPYTLNTVGTPTVSIQGHIAFNNTKAPIGIKGFYKYKSDSALTGSLSPILFKGGDTVAGYADLTKLQAAITANDTLDALVYSFAKTNSWTSFSLSFTANVLGGFTSIPATIDSIRIVAITCSPSGLVTGKSSAGDSLFLDQLEFIYATGPVAIASVESGATFSVSQNVPNPFSGTTAITVNTPNAGALQFTVVDMLGRVVNSQTINASAGANTITYAAGADSGTYFYTISDGVHTVTKKMVVYK
jgi:hypothetical protein